MLIFGIFYFKDFCHDFKIISLNNMYSEQNLKIITYYSDVLEQTIKGLLGGFLNEC